MKYELKEHLNTFLHVLALVSGVMLPVYLFCLAIVLLPKGPTS